MPSWKEYPECNRILMCNILKKHVSSLLSIGAVLTRELMYIIKIICNASNHKVGGHFSYLFVLGLNEDNKAGRCERTEVRLIYIDSLCVRVECEPPLSMVRYVAGGLSCARFQTAACRTLELVIVSWDALNTVSPPQSLCTLQGEWRKVQQFSQYV